MLGTGQMKTGLAQGRLQLSPRLGRRRSKRSLDENGRADCRAFLSACCWWPCQGSLASHICNHFLTGLVRLGPRYIVALVPHQPLIGPWFSSNFCALDSIGRKRTVLSRLQHTQHNNPSIRNVYRSRPCRDTSWCCSVLRTTSLVRCLPSAN